MNSIPPRNRNERFARILLDELARAGVRHLVVAPGSRSTPLVLAAASDSRFHLAVQVDERSAAFLALGVGKGTGVPAAVICTSGTAVANLLPAVVEASQSETPLLVLSADRPPRLRGSDANQAIDQNHLFGGYTRFYQELSPAALGPAELLHLRGVAGRAVAQAVGDPPGPVHLNLAFEKPLEPLPVEGDLDEASEALHPLATLGRDQRAPFTTFPPRRTLPTEAVLESLRRQLSQARRPVLVAGPVSRPFESGPELVRLARSLGIPLLADPLSGARVAGAGASYDLLLRIPEVAKSFVPDLILRFGATPSSVTLATWLEAQRDTPHLVVEGGGRWKDHLLVASAVVEGDPARVARALLESSLSCSELDPDWIEGWTRAERMAAQAVEGVLKSQGLAEGMAALEAAEDALRRKGVLFLSNSMPVRDVDTLWPAGASRNGESGEEGQPLPALGNRGASGIDGIVSTALGAAWGAGTPLTALLGDLALLYDMNGFLARWPEGVGHAATSPGALPPVVFLVVNNRGGGIFHLLPVREHEPAFTPLVATPHEVEPEAIAALHGLPFERVEGRGAPQGMGEALRGALKEAGLRSMSSGRPALVELRTDREENRLAHEALRRAVAEAFGGESVR